MSDENPERRLAARPKLPSEYMDRLAVLKKEAENRVFFKFEEDDTAIVEIIKRDEITTSVGQSPCYTARYLSGNIHGTGGGAPPEPGQTFRFWSTTVLENLLGEVGADNGDVVCIACLGEKRGAKNTYKNFVVDLVQSAPRSFDGAKAPEAVQSPQETL